ncbi:DUF5105 domain-containing protein [Bacillus sp. WMMC1349]|uniref:DUF5105 domain-containing protein n=1 Tax=Bacillus sp. WMMC1349 TaxID=2736254 RepID=UPI0015567615|nr:DUF5105 domain-containing protein [Bacillus sp. WMMC1349]NPC91426.1 DUF5105 domain-containing protein [Bacillus sp. WMMC1349]
MRSKKLLLIMLLMFTAIFATACGGSKGSDSKSASKDEKTAEGENGAKVEIVSTEYALPEYKIATNLGENELILKVKVSVKNTSKEPLEVSNDDFSLYQGKSKVSDETSYDDRIGYENLNPDKSIEGSLYYKVDKGEKYQLEYTPSLRGTKKGKTLTFNLDGNDFMDSAKKLQEPAQALQAYTDITLFGQDNSDFETLTGENKRKIVTDYLEGAQKSFTRSFDIYESDSINKKKLNKLISAVQQTYKEKSKLHLETVSINNTDNEATVKATITPIDSSGVKERVQKRIEEYGKKSGKDYISREDLINPTIDILAEEFKHAETASTEKTIDVKMKKTKDGKWQLDVNGYSAEDYFSSFYGTN